MKADAYGETDPGVFNEMQVLKTVQAWQVFRRYQELDGYFVSLRHDEARFVEVE
jgi:hypothetical protein